MTDQTEFSGRVALITGTSRGIGRATALAMAEAGAHIIAVARTQGALEELDDEILAKTGKNATLVPLDLKDFDAIDRLGGAIFEKFKRLDFMIANAGILGELTPVPHLEPKVWQDLLDINVTANYRLIRAMDPLLRAGDQGRAIFLSTGIIHHPRAYWGGYAASKAALEMLATIYADEVNNTNLRVNCVNPGATRTHMRAKAFPGEDPDTLPRPEDVAPLFVAMCRADWTGHGELINYRDWATENA
jgi:NAD(P)-dependent dehydrogenase (short-subunit alcohol dehydrogenase family)